MFNGKLISSPLTPSFLCNRKLLLVSKHKKEQVIAPLLKQHFGTELIVASKVDTDQFGTFSGEVERLHNPYETARLKINEAVRLYPEEDLFIASEGSFFSHPEVPFLSINQELILLYDKKYNEEFCVTHHSTETNLNKIIATTWESARVFATLNKFPSHAMIVMPNETKGTKPIYKGISSFEELEEAFDTSWIISIDQTVCILTDMRACYNPTRMKHIEHTTQLLVDKLKSFCPNCLHPGYDRIEKVRGLPCESCGKPTSEVMSWLYKCSYCSFQEEKHFPGGKTVAYAGHCDYCNP